MYYKGLTPMSDSFTNKASLGLFAKLSFAGLRTIDIGIWITFLWYFCIILLRVLRLENLNHFYSHGKNQVTWVWR